MDRVSTWTSHRIDMLFALQVQVLLLLLCLIASLDRDLLGQVLEVHLASVLVKLTLCFHHVLYLPHLDGFVLEGILSGTWLSDNLFVWLESTTILGRFGSSPFWTLSFRLCQVL